ncbi:tyrosine-type recombinase/integrase [Listeria booriae]|uniref:tyrosine-type recombinase/integrase n=1 Tax=Listeria booriae TaxID=1552123 RepID=UPI0021AD6466|nr:site-specific integrase [Listeria booriae]
MKITRKKNGKYTTRVRVKINGEWAARRLTDDDKDELLYRATRLKNMYKKQEIEDKNKKWRMGEFYHLVIDTFKTEKVSDSTIDLYRLAYDQFDAYFGDIELEAVTRIDYQNFINHLGNDYSLSTVDTRHRKIRALFYIAVDLGYIKNSPTKGAVMSGKDVSKDKVMFMESDKVTLLLTELKKEYSVVNAAIMLAVNAGLRFEEIIALTKKDIDFKNRIVHVTKAWDYKYKNDFVDTKTKKSRKIFIDASTNEYLKSYVAWHDSHTSDTANEYGLIFNNKGKSKPVTNNTVNTAIKRLCHKIETDEITIHRLRHTHTCLCVEAGLDIIYVSDRLGHQNINTTLKYYTHLSKTIRDNNQERVDKFFAS